MIKKTVVCVMLSVMMAASICGCGKTEESAKSVEVTEAVSEETTETKTEEEMESETEEVSEETEAVTEATTEAVTEAETEAATEAATLAENADDDKNSATGKKVEYGNTIKVHFVRQGRGAVSESQGKDNNEFVILEEGEKEFAVSKETTDVFCPYDYEVEEEQIMENVNKAIGLKTGDSFTIGCEYGDGYYETIYEILDIY